MKITLKDHFTYGRLLRFTFPSIMMMIFTSIYGIVDGFFISNYVGSLQFAAVNLIMPMLMIFGALGTVFGSGGSALISMVRGMGKQKEANEIFSFIIYFVIIFGTALSVFGYFICEPVARLLGATKEMLPYCVQYAQINMLGNMQFMLQYLFQSFMVTAERPKLGLGVTIAAGVTNMVLDALFMGVFHMGVDGAAWATIISQTVGGFIPLVYFILPQKSPYRLGKTRFNGRWLKKAATNGSSEFMSTISSSIVSILYNFQLLKFAGADGVAAYGVIMYTNFIFTGVYFGYTMGSAPVVSYHYGAGNTDELKSLLKKSLTLILIFALSLTGLAELFAGRIAGIFVGYDADLLKLTTGAFRIYAIAFLFMGFNVYGSGFFTALNNGKVSAFLSFFRTLVLQCVSILILPSLFGINGVWLSIVFAESIAIVITFTLLKKYRNRYHYA